MKQPLKKDIPKQGLTNKDHRKQNQKPIKQVKNKRYVDLLALAIIILLGIEIYSNSFNCSFHFDDMIQIVNNPDIRNLADFKAWWNSSPSRPVGMVTFALNYHFNQLDVRYYHFVNLIIHLINSYLVWWLTVLIFSSPAMKDQPIARNKKVLAFLTALLFVSHPLATQSVTYIVQRLASMVAMFYFLSLALYMKARLSDKGDVSKTLLFIASLVSAVLAMLTKENAFTLPFAILLIEFFFLTTKKKFAINFRDYRIILFILALLGIIIIIPLKVSFNIFKPIAPTEGHTYTVTPVNYLLTQFTVIVKYIQLLFLPINQKFIYDFPISNNFFEMRTLLSFLVLISLIISAIFSFKRFRIISFGIFWFFLTLSIESSFIPISDIIFEHRTYLPSFGFFLIISSGIYYLLWNKNKYLAISIFVIIIGSNSFLTFMRNYIWKDELTFWNDNVTKKPNLSTALMNRGLAYATLGQWEKAIDDYSKAIENAPIDAETYDNRGVAYCTLEQWGKAIDDFSRAIKIDSNFLRAYYNRGITYGRIGQLDKSIADYSRIIQIYPKSDKAYSNRGVDYFNLGQFDKAISDYSMAILINPNYTDAFYNRGLTYGKLGKWENAIADYSKVLEIDPNNTMAYSSREDAYEKLRDKKK
jgi:tetratricopeptide (TPR) repeat protein